METLGKAEKIIIWIVFNYVTINLEGASILSWGPQGIDDFLDQKADHFFIGT